MNNVATIPQMTWTPEQMKLITETIARGATKNELELFLYRCKNLGLDPLKSGQIYFIKYGNGPGTIVIGIEGFRSLAAKTGKLAGIKRGAIKDDKGVLIGAYAEVFRSDWKECAREEVPLVEYNTGKSQWAKMPETMIKKVAEAAALRMAFPDDLGGVYTQEEMDQANKTTVYPEQPMAEDGDPNAVHGYVVPFGKFAKCPLEQIGPDELRNYVAYIESDSLKKNKPITGQVKDFIERAEAYIGACENESIDQMGDAQE